MTEDLKLLFLDHRLRDSGAYALVEKYWAAKGPPIRYEFTDTEDYYASTRSETFAPTIVVSTHITRNNLASDQFLCVFLLHELGHLDHIRRMYLGMSPKIEKADVDMAEAEADDFVISCGLKDELIRLRERVEEIRIAKGLEETVNTRRLRRLRELPNEATVQIIR